MLFLAFLFLFCGSPGWAAFWALMSGSEGWAFIFFILYLMKDDNFQVIKKKIANKKRSG